MTREILFHKGDFFFDGLLKECKRARHEILIEAYIFETDELGKRLLRVLKKKAREGVKVRILMDGIGSSSFCPLLYKKLSHPNFEIRIFNPLPHQLATNANRSLKSILSPLLKGLFTINKRNHRKTYIIDKRIAFVGSINITSLHSLRLRGERSWRDTGIKIKDERVQLLRTSFLRAWRDHLDHLSSKENLKDALINLKSGLRLNDGTFSRALQNRDLIRRIESAQKRVWIMNPYFVPTKELIEALTRASQKGINVTILIPRKSDMKLFPLINSLSTRHLADKGIKIFEYLPRILHSKVVIIDQWCVVGSSNMNSRSFRHDYEVDVVLRDPNNKESLIKQFLFDLADSVELKKKDILKRYGPQSFSTIMLNLIRYWL
jgi:cardiolipin synthase